MIHWSGFAEIRFGESAHLVLARAVEQSGSDALALFPDAWLVEDRRITLNVETSSPRADMVAVKRLLSELLTEAEQGEAVIDVPPYERWSRSAGRTPSINQLFDAAPPSAALPVVDDQRHETIPMSSHPRPRSGRLRGARFTSSSAAALSRRGRGEPRTRTRRSS